MGLFNNEKPAVASSLENGQVPASGHGKEDLITRYDDDLHIECPPHTTERKLVTRIDFHVLPFLCIMYLLGESCRGQLCDSQVTGHQ